MGDLNTDSQNQLIADFAAQFDRLAIFDAANTLLVEFTITFGSATGGSASVTGTPKDQAASATGTAAKASYRHSSNPEELSNLSVGTSGAEVNLNTLEIENGETVTLKSATLNAPTTTS